MEIKQGNVHFPYRCPVVVTSHTKMAALAQKLKAFMRIGAITHDVSEAPQLLGFPSFLDVP